MAGISVHRLFAEHEAWCNRKPPGFVAELAKNSDGSLNIMIWECYIPGNKSGLWEGCKYFMRMTFSEDYPIKPPHCLFDPPLFHPNVYPDGTIYSSMLDETKDWRPNITVQEILLKIQDLLDNPDLNDRVNFFRSDLYCNNCGLYEECVLEQVQNVKKQSTQ